MLSSNHGLGDLVCILGRLVLGTQLLQLVTCFIIFVKGDTSVLDAVFLRGLSIFCFCKLFLSFFSLLILAI